MIQPPQMTHKAYRNNDRLLFYISYILYSKELMRSASERALDIFQDLFQHKTSENILSDQDLLLLMENLSLIAEQPRRRRWHSLLKFETSYREMIKNMQQEKIARLKRIKQASQSAQQPKKQPSHSKFFNWIRSAFTRGFSALKSQPQQQQQWLKVQLPKEEQYVSDLNRKPINNSGTDRKREEKKMK